MESHNLKISIKLSEFLQNLGVEKVVVCPGSRNAPLIFTLQNNSSFEVFHHLDERSAAFFALGLTMNTQKPVAVLCTSGTAVAELLPATVEAYYQNLPLILISADRPAHFRGTGAPQSIDQVGLFSQYAKCFDLEKAESFSVINFDHQFPLHLNLCLEEPAAGDWPEKSEEVNRLKYSKEKNEISKEDLEVISSFCDHSQSLLVMLGSLPQEEVKKILPFLATLGAPVLADSTANLPLEGAHSKYVLKCGEKLLRKWKPTHVLRLGSVPSFRFWRDLETHSVEVLNVTLSEFAKRSFSGLGRKTKTLRVDSYQELATLEVESHENASLDFLEKDQVLASQLEEIIARYPYSELSFIRKLRKYTRGMLYLGNSMPIREWNLINGTHSTCFANRGVNGIDGQVSTYLGLADLYPESWALLGDQTALYDLNALALSNQQSRNKKFTSKRRIVVMNNGGGKIFSHLNYSHKMDAGQRKVLESHHRWEFRNWAEMFAWGYERWEKDDALFEVARDDVVLEICPDSSQTHRFWSDWRSVE